VGPGPQGNAVIPAARNQSRDFVGGGVVDPAINLLLAFVFGVLILGD